MAWLRRISCGSCVPRPPETRSHGFEGFQPGSGPYKVEAGWDSRGVRGAGQNRSLVIVLDMFVSIYVFLMAGLTSIVVYSWFAFWGLRFWLSGFLGLRLFEGFVAVVLLVPMIWREQEANDWGWRQDGVKKGISFFRALALMHLQEYVGF